jgi:hypothetical protein
MPWQKKSRGSSRNLAKGGNKFTILQQLAQPDKNIHREPFQKF